MTPGPISKWFREPLLHFLLLGAAIFGLSAWLSPPLPPGGASAVTAGDKNIVVNADRIALLKNGFLLDNGREPTLADLQRLIDNYIRQEVFVREARAQGLDRDDSIVRQRLVQKMEFAVAEPAPPPDAELEKYLAAHSQTFRTADNKLPSLADIHAAVLAAWTNDQRKQEVEAVYRHLLTQYHVTVETPTTQPAGGKS